MSGTPDTIEVPTAALRGLLTAWAALTADVRPGDCTARQADAMAGGDLAYDQLRDVCT